MLQVVQHASVALLQIPSKAFANFRENRELFAMANFDPIVSHFQAVNKCFSKGQTQPPQGANCSQHTNEGAEAFELSNFLGLEQEFVNSCQSEDAGDQSCNLNTVKSGQGLERDYARPFPSDLACFQENNLDLNSTVIQTHQPSETINCKTTSKKRKADEAVKYSFLTRSETDILHDGYKWRKYGRKFLKNSPNPRNYYRCSNSNCDVKKTVERDPHDKGIVITTYIGQHNHEIPTVIYYIGRHEPHLASTATPNY